MISTLLIRTIGSVASLLVSTPVTVKNEKQSVKAVNVPLLVIYLYIDIQLYIEFINEYPFIGMTHKSNVNRIGGVMVSVLASSAVYREFESRSGQIKYYIIGICCFSAKYAALSRESKDWLSGNQDNVFEWGEMSIRGLLFQ